MFPTVPNDHIVQYNLEDEDAKLVPKQPSEQNNQSNPRQKQSTSKNNMYNTYQNFSNCNSTMVLNATEVPIDAPKNKKIVDIHESNLTSNGCHLLVRINANVLNTMEEQNMS